MINPNTPVNYGNLILDETVPDVTEITSNAIQFVGGIGSVFYIDFDGGEARYFIDIQVFGDRWSEVAEGPILAPPKNLTTVNIKFYIPRARVRFKAEPGATFPSLLSISGYAYPAVYQSDGC